MENNGVKPINLGRNVLVGCTKDVITSMRANHLKKGGSIDDLYPKHLVSQHCNPDIAKHMHDNFYSKL